MYYINIQVYRRHSASSLLISIAVLRNKGIGNTLILSHKTFNKKAPGADFRGLYKALFLKSSFFIELPIKSAS